MMPHDLLDEGESEADAGIAFPVALGAEEGLEDALSIALGDAVSSVQHV